MIEADRLIDATEKTNEDSIDRAIRPKLLADYRGQPHVKQQMEIFIEAARSRDEALDHLLIFGPPGLGKTTLANIVANELNVNIKTTSGPVLEKAGDLAALLTNLEEGDVLFIDEIHTLGGAGAAEGAMFGAGNADSADDIATQTGLGALIGAGAGAVAPVAVAGARAVARPVAGLFNGALGRPSQAAAGGMLSRTLARTGDDISTLERRIAEAAEQSQEMFVTADAMGYPGQALLSGVARQPGEGAANIRDFLASRQMDQAPRVSGFLEDALGAPQTATQTREALETTRGALANEQFGAARQNARPVDVRGALGFIDEQVQPMQGMPGGAIDSALSRYRDRLSMPASALPDGVDAMDLSEFDRVYRVRQDLADDIGAAYRAGNNNQVRMLTDLRNRLDDALEASSDEYAGAMASFRDQSRVIDAIETGQRAGTRGRSDDILDVFRGMADQTPTPGTNVGPLRDGSGLPMAPQGMPSNQQDGFRAGLADTLMGRVENARPGANVVPPLQSMRNTEILNEVVGAPSPLPQQLQREATMAETNRIAVGGSPTADRLADQADMGDIGTLMSTGSPTATLMQMMARGAGSAITNRNEATRTLLAQALMSGNPREALEPLMRNAMMQARGDRTGEALLRQLAYGQLGVTGPP